MLVKGIKKGKNIQLLEEINLPDNQEVLVEIKKADKFWTALQDFRERVDLDALNDDNYDNLRDKSMGRDVVL